jgi:hypothetical protein
MFLLLDRFKTQVVWIVSIIASNGGNRLSHGVNPSTPQQVTGVMPCVPRRWTSYDDDHLRSLARAGRSLRSPAIAMNRSYVSVQNRAAKLNVRFAKRSSQSDHENRVQSYNLRQWSLMKSPAIKRSGG